jgi:hypothetical protein
MLQHPVVAVLAGASFGYAWHRLVGCRSGACPLTANPWIATGDGAFLGWLTSH